jgi:hypothetical protein
MEIEKLPIRLVCATRLPPQQFFTHSLTGITVNAFRSVSKVEIMLFAENTIGLSELYNRAIDGARNNPAILVFMHDDITICDYHWEKRIRDGLNSQFDIVGLAGNKRRIKNQVGWRTIDMRGTLDADENLSGVVGCGSNFPPQSLCVFGPTGAECKLLDGLFLSADSRTLWESGLRFDPLFKFHFYDLDFCRSAEQLNLKMGTIPLSVVHASEGDMSDSWRSAYADYIAKWKE